MKAADRSGASTARDHRRRRAGRRQRRSSARCAATASRWRCRAPISSRRPRRSHRRALVALPVVPADRRRPRCAPTCAASCAPTTSARPSSVCGWVARRREHGEHLAFVDVRDHSGVVQCVVDNADRRAQRVRRADHRHRARSARRARSTRTCRPARSRSATATVEVLRAADAAAVPDRRPGRRRRRERPPAVPLPRPAARADAAQPARPGRRQLGDPPGDGGSGFRRGRDADARAVDAGGRPRVPRAVAQGAGLVLRPAAVAAAVQAAADGGRRRPLLPDRPLPARRGPARRPPVRVHAARRRDELRLPGRRAGGDLRGRARRRRGGHRRAPADDRADHVARGDGALRRRQARPALRHGARRAHRRVRRRPSSRRSPSAASIKGDQRARARRGSTGATSSTSSPTGPRRSAPRASCG